MPVFTRARLLKRFALAWVALLICLAGLPLQAYATSFSPLTNARYQVLGSPSVSADFIDSVLVTSHSPAAGKGQALYADGVKYGIDPVFALAFFLLESNFGTHGVAQVTRSLGNIRCTSGDRSCYQGYRKYASWEDGFVDWYQLISNFYVNQLGLTTVDQIVPVYAPPNENDVSAYIVAVQHAVDTWKDQQVDTSYKRGSSDASSSSSLLRNRRS